MTSAVFRPTRIALHRPWWQRLRDELRAARERRARLDAERDLRHSLAGLSQATLRDIGAPEWLHESDWRVEWRWLERGHE